MAFLKNLLVLGGIAAGYQWGLPYLYHQAKMFTLREIAKGPPTTGWFHRRIRELDRQEAERKAAEAAKKLR